MKRFETAATAVVAELKRAPIMAAKPTGEEVQLAEMVTTPPALMQLAVAKPEALPSTASPVPMFGLLGTLALGAAFAARSAAKRLR